MQCCLPLVLAHVADPGRCRLVMDAGDTLVRLGGPAERRHAGGEHVDGSSLRLGRVALGRFQPLAGGDGMTLNDVPVPFPELLKPRADGVKPGIDLPPTEQTVRFAFEGIGYEIDLNAKNAAAFGKQLAPYLEHARKAGRTSARRPGRTAAGRQRSGDIRAWAKEQGLAVSARGRIRADVVEQYQAASGR